MPTRPSSDRVRAYRARKRNGVTPHGCPQCGREHYPPGNPATDANPVTPSEPSCNTVTEVPGNTVTANPVTSPEPASCDRCASARATAQAAIDKGKRLAERAQAAEHMSRTMQAYLEDCQAAMTPQAWARLESKWEAEAAD